MDDAVSTIPEVIEPRRPADYLEVITRAVFQAGVSWAQIARHWGAYRRAFMDFDPAIVATFDTIDIERVLSEPGILRMPRKVNATVKNAQTLLGLEREFGSTAQYFASFPSYAALARDIKKRFSFMGDMNVWYFLFRTGNPVPHFEEWVTTIPGDHPRMREMVELARSLGTSPEALV
jgi:3-methyladenine DNA glycosylase Tag